MPKVIEKDKQTKIKANLPQVRNTDLKNDIFKFDGQWLPSVDATLIGAKNYQDLVNMRYTEGGIEGVNGYGTALHTDSEADLKGRFSNGPSGAIAYCNQKEALVWEGTEADIMTLFTTQTDDPDEAPAFPVDETDSVRNSIISDYFVLSTADRSYGIILSTAPLQGIKLYIDPDNANTNAANTDAIVVKYWNGSALTAVSNLTDGTSKLTKTGTLSFDSTVSSAKPKHYKERYAYAYTYEVTASSGTTACNVYQVTLDKPMQAPTNIWDGIYRQPIQVQRYTDSNKSYEDFTVLKMLFEAS